MSTTFKHAFQAQRGVDTIQSINVSDKINPEIVDTHSQGWKAPNKMATIDSDHIIVTNRDRNQIVIVDVSNPESLSVVGSVTSNYDFRLFAYYRRISRFLSETYSNFEPRGIDTKSLLNQRAIDRKIAKLKRLSPILNKNLSDMYGIVVDGNNAYVVDRHDSMGIIDISDRSNPIINSVITDSTVLEGATHLGYRNDHVFVSCGGYPGKNTNNRIVSIDVSNPHDPTIVDEISSIHLDQADGLAVSGDYAYVGGYIDRKYLTTVDISDPSEMQIVNVINDSKLNGIFGMDMFSNYLFVAPHGFGGIIAFDISNGGNPEWAGEISFDSGSHMQALCVNGNSVYTTSGGDKPTFRVTDWYTK